MNKLLLNLKNVIFNIFGDMFFLFPEEYEDEALQEKTIAFPSNWIKYGITISKEESEYTLFFYFTPAQAELMAENFLGMEKSELSNLIIRETIKEAVNVIGGNLLNSIDGDYHLGIPKEYSTEPKDKLNSDFNNTTHILVNVEDEPFMAVMDSRFNGQF